MARKLTKAILLSIASILLLATPVLAYLYRAPVTITESASTNYDMLPILWTQNNDWLADNGFMSSTANDTRMQTLAGSSKPWMVADNKTLTAVPIPAGSQTNLYFVTGESEASAMDIIVGYNGYFTISDNASTKITDNGTVTVNAYLLESGDIFRKKAAITAVYDSTTANVTASVLADSYTNPTGNTANGWTNPTMAYDDNTGNYANMFAADGVYTNYLVFSIASTLSDSIRFWISDGAVSATLTADLDAYYGSTWNDVFEGVVSTGGYQIKNLSTYPPTRQSITQVRLRLKDNVGGTDKRINEIDFQEDSVTTTVTAAGVTAGVHTVATSVNATSGDLEIRIDGALSSVAFGGSVPDSGNDYIVMSSATPYMTLVYITLDGAEASRYEPTAMILGTNLPDETGSNNGTITWGANPAGIGVTLSSMVSSGQPSIGSTVDTSTSDILPVTGGTDWRPDTAVSAKLLANPLRPIVIVISDNTTLSEYQVWVWFGIIFVAFITALVGANVRGHHLITGIAASAAIVLLVVWTVFPLLSLLVVVLAILGGLVSERSPSL